MESKIKRTISVFSNKKLLPAFQLLQHLQPVTILFSDWSFRPVAIINNIKNVLRADIVYLHSPSNLRVILLLIAKILRKKTMVQWIGGDVLLATHNKRPKFYDVGDDKEVSVDKCILSGLQGIEYFFVYLTIKFSWLYVVFLKLFVDHHVACAKHLAQELSEVGIDASYLPIINPVEPELLPWPERVSVLAYLGFFKSSDTKDYYGWKTVLRLAKDFPDLEIIAIGQGAPINYVPDNVKVIGFVNDIKDVLSQVRGVLRISYYDGTPRLIIEGLATGRYVAYTREFPCSSLVDSYDDAKKFINLIKGVNEQNIAGHRLIVDDFSPTRITGLYMKEFENCLKRK